MIHTKATEKAGSALVQAIRDGGERMPSVRSLPSAVNGIASAVELCHGLALAAGWYDDVHTGEPIERNQGEQIALIHGELSQALEGLRTGSQDRHLPHRKRAEVELTDALIRILQLAGALRMDLSGALVEKLAYNAKRADHKPESRAAAGGKKF